MVFLLLTLAWGLNSLLSSIWLGFLIVLVLLLIFTVVAFLARPSPAERRCAGSDDGDRGGQIDQGNREPETGSVRLMPQTRTRSPEEIRASIEQNREQLGTSIEKLRVEVVRLTDWRAPLRKHQQQVMIGAGVAGFVLGGGIAALGALTIGRRRNKK